MDYPIGSAMHSIPPSQLGSRSTFEAVGQQALGFRKRRKEFVEKRPDVEIDEALGKHPADRTMHAAESLAPKAMSASVGGCNAANHLAPTYSSYVDKSARASLLGPRASTENRGVS